MVGHVICIVWVISPKAYLTGNGSVLALVLKYVGNNIFLL
jgi:hypothetical protein